MNIIDELSRATEILLNGKRDGLSLREIESTNYPYVGYLYDFMRHKLNKAINKGDITNDEYAEFTAIYNDCKKNNKTNKHIVSQEEPTPITTEPKILIKNNLLGPVLDESLDNDTDFDGDESPKVLLPKATIPVNNDADYVCYYTAFGTQHLLTVRADDMDVMCRYYSSDGGNLSQKQVGAKFNLTKAQVREVFKVYNITKSSPPFAPHVLRDTPTEELLERTMLIKEQMVCERLNMDRVKVLEKRNYELLTQIKTLKSVDSIVDLSTIKRYTPSEYRSSDSDKHLFIYISDCHVGAHVGNRSIYENVYNKEVFRQRLDTVVNTVVEATRGMDISRVIVCNLGDSLDGYNKKTTRGGHSLPQNMDNKEQFQSYVEEMITFFDKLYTSNIAPSVDYVCVGESNHDGAFGWAANYTLGKVISLRYSMSTVTVFDKFIGHINYGEHTFIFTHGKDDYDMIKNMPLNVNDKTINFFNEYISTNVEDVQRNIHVIKGDLHQSNTNYCRAFRYKNVPSVFGSSQWIHHNFGNTRAGVDYDIVDTLSDSVLSGKISF